MTLNGLYINRYSVDGSHLLESFGDQHGGLRARCALPYWCQKFSFIVRAKSVDDARRRWREHQGQWMVLHDDFGTLLSGQVYRIERDGRHVLYECAGAARRHSDDFFTDFIDPADGISDVLQQVLTAQVPAVTVLARNFDSNATAVGDVYAQEIAEGDGVLPAEIINALLAMRDVGATTYDYWAQAAPFANGVYPVADHAYYQGRSKTATYADWYVDARALLQDDGREIADIYERRNKIHIRYGKVTGTTTSANIYLIDSTTDFAAAGIRTGDIVTNLTKTTSLGVWVGCAIAAITSTTNPNDTLTMRLSESETWASSDAYSIRLSEPGVLTVTDSDTSDLWDASLGYLDMPELNATQAAQLAADLLEDYTQATFQDSFSIGGRYIQKIDGSNWPTWRLLKAPGLMRVVGRTNTAESRSINLVQRRGLFVVAVDYDHNGRVATVTPTSPSARLDVTLQRAGLVAGQAIAPAGRSGNADPLAAAYIESFRRRGGGADPLIFWDWRFGPPPADWEARMRAEGLNPQVGPNPADIFRNYRSGGP